MTFDFRNTNSLWASVLVETLKRLGLKQAVVCPGSRSTPLTVALARHPDLKTIPVLDERSASFFALGIAKAAGQPVVLVCTSGTAGANFYPAIIEAHESRIPLIVLTADRPPELRDCGSGQTIDQQKLFGNFPNWYSELAIPQANLNLLGYLRQTMVQAWQRSRYPVPGPVHLNCPFRDPLSPVADDTTAAIAQTLNPQTFFPHLPELLPDSPPGVTFPSLTLTPALPLPTSAHGLILAGPTEPADPLHYCQAVAHLSQCLGWPVLAEALSPLRNYAALNPHLIANYDGILRNGDVAQQLKPDQVIQLGPLPTSKVLRQWLTAINPLRWIIDGGDRNFDALHGNTLSLPHTVETVVTQLPQKPSKATPYLKRWKTLDMQFQQQLDETFRTLSLPVESKVAWLLSQYLPQNTPLLIANSMPVRDLEWFWSPNNRHIRPYFNRGANGIDGTLSTALGLAQHHRQAVLLTGDLALLHDANGFLIANSKHKPEGGARFQGHLTILVINNQGGGIFEMLPIAQFEPPFETFFATPQNIDFAALCHAYHIEHQLIKTWTQCVSLIESLPQTGVRVLELQTNRKTDVQWRQTTLQAIADRLIVSEGI